ncbi:hypothetical protein QQF64_009226 [Cirrhinus molitorella]|uniref:Secreted protein n=1 Tax=Cirrhinus molitorella TaxID=172907 RepID=A0ABR3M0J9_9TELE
METRAGRSGKRSVAAMLTCCGCSLLCTRTRASHNFCRPCQEGPDAANRCRHCQEPWHTHTPPNNTNSDIQKGMQIHRAEMI